MRKKIYHVEVAITGKRAGYVIAESQTDACDLARELLEEDQDNTDIDWVEYHESYTATEDDEG